MKGDREKYLAAGMNDYVSKADQVERLVRGDRPMHRREAE